MQQTQLSDKFFFGMSYNEQLQNLIELNISSAFLVSDEGFV
jgi:hypothetical protein